MKYKAFEGCSSLSLGGVDIEINDGVVEVDGYHQFLIDHGFTPIAEDQPSELDLLKEEARALGITFPHNIGLAKLTALVEEAKKQPANGENEEQKPADENVDPENKKEEA